MPYIFCSIFLVDLMVLINCRLVEDSCIYWFVTEIKVPDTINCWKISHFWKWKGFNSKQFKLCYCNLRQLIVKNVCQKGVFRDPSNWHTPYWKLLGCSQKLGTASELQQRIWGCIIFSGRPPCLYLPPGPKGTAWKYIRHGGVIAGLWNWPK